MAAVFSAGAAAVSLATSRSRRPAEAPPTADAALVGLIERVADATSRSSSVEEALLACVEHVCRWTGWPVGHVYLTQGDPDLCAVPTQLWHLGDPQRFERFRELTERTPMPSGVGLPGRVLDSGRAEWIVDVTCDANFPRRVEAARVGLRGGFSFPVPIRDRCFAVIECFSLEAVTPDDRLLQVASHIGRQVGRVIDNMQMADALRQSESRLRSVADSANDAIIAADAEGRILSWNPGAERMFGYREDELLGGSLSLLMPERFRAMHDAGLRRVVERPDSSRMIGKTFEVVGLRKDGTEFPIELSLAMWETREGRFFSGIIRDIAARRDAEDQARALESAPDPIVKVDAGRRIVLANARTEQLFGYARSELIGRPVEDLFDAHCNRRVSDRFHAALAAGDSGGGYGAEFTGRRKDGSEFPVDVTLSQSRGADGGPVVTSILRDVTERKRFESQLQHLADHDHLTALFNRRRFEQELSEYVADAARRGGRGAVLLLDLDRFKYVNDTQGHGAGDDLVRSIGKILLAQVADTDVVARLGGDEFAVLLKETGQADAERAAGAILSAVRANQMPLGGVAVAVTTSIGVALFGDCEPPVDDLLGAADTAMYAAKESGGNRYQVYAGDDERVAGMQARLAWADQIRRALDDDRFVLYSQPIIEIQTGRATHHELLLRMVGNHGEMIAPGAFIETAERFGLIQELDRWVVRNAIGLLASDGPDEDHKLEVNLSGKSIGDPDLPELIERELRRTGVDPARLIFEITETAAIANMDQARAFAERLTRLGCRFALDDFGAGFSSFYYLKHLPLDYLKIDGDFIRGLTTNVTDQLVVKSMVDIARGMGMKTIAEFVENAETFAMLHEYGVDYSQGYYHGRPQPVSLLALQSPAGVIAEIDMTALS
jgi:diguanylate cyclase (GGDEF)-like protein/PAS domain S-box-containing protein